MRIKALLKGVEIFPDAFDAPSLQTRQFFAIVLQKGRLDRQQCRRRRDVNVREALLGSEFLKNGLRHDGFVFGGTDAGGLAPIFRLRNHQIARVFVAFLLAGLVELFAANVQNLGHEFGWDHGRELWLDGDHLSNLGLAYGQEFVGLDRGGGRQKLAQIFE